MSDFDDFDYDFTDYEDELQQLPRDSKIDEAKQAFMDELFHKKADKVYYERQIEVLYERRFFHWISAKALKELASENAIHTILVDLYSGRSDKIKTPIRFYWARHSSRLRYTTRQANSVRKIVQSFSVQKFTNLLGHTGETLFDQALPWAGFMPIAKDARSYKGKEWTKTGEDLDRIFEKDGIAYGVEIKNSLRYIPRLELQSKTEMCLFLGLRPLFIVRAAPGSYIYETHQQGGFTLVFQYHLYPLSHLEMAQHVSSTLGIPADAPRAIESGTIQRLVKNHEWFKRKRQQG